MGHSKDLEVPLPDKKIGGSAFIFIVILGLYQSLQINKILFELFVSENKQKIFNEASNEIGTCSEAINTRSIVMMDCWVSAISRFFEVNLFREV